MAVCSLSKARFQDTCYWAGRTALVAKAETVYAGKDNWHAVSVSALGPWQVHSLRCPPAN